MNSSEMPRGTTATTRGGTIFIVASELKGSVVYREAVRSEGSLRVIGPSDTMLRTTLAELGQGHIDAGIDAPSFESLRALEQAETLDGA